MQRLLSRFCGKGEISPLLRNRWHSSCESVGPREGGGGAVVDRGVWNRGIACLDGRGRPATSSRPPLVPAPLLLELPALARVPPEPDIAPEALIPPPLKAPPPPFPALLVWPPEPDVALLLRWYRRCALATTAAACCSVWLHRRCHLQVPKHPGRYLWSWEQACELARGSSEDSDGKHAPDGKRGGEEFEVNLSCPSNTPWLEQGKSVKSGDQSIHLGVNVVAADKRP